MEIKKSTKKNSENKIVLKRESRARDMSPERWMEENFEEVKYKSLLERAPGVFILWIEKRSDKKKG